MTTLQIYHNPRCSKSRAALTLLEERQLQPAIIEYLKEPPTESDLQALVKKLGIKPEELVRKTEPIYREMYAGKAMTDAQWIAALAKHPILIERPIVVMGKRAVIGRPPERVLDLIE